MPVTMTDEEITKLAKARASFKVHLMAYVAVNVFLAGVWLVTSGGGSPSFRDNNSGSYYWPIWTHLGWGLGLLLHYFFSMGPGQGLQAREEARIRESLGGR
jgi:hypothetical protein